MNLRSLSFSLAAIAVAVAMSPLGARADIDKKFYKKAAEKVWSMDLPQFDPAADLSDSLYRDRAAVYIARYNGLVAEHDDGMSGTKESLTGISNLNAIKASQIDRRMVKINDASALEHFSEFEIEAPQKQMYHGLTLVSVKPAFGARIISPDGSVKEVDINEALTVTEGKKNKDSEYKIAIPGLEPGMVLDYFYYTEFYVDESSLPPFTYALMRTYPTRDLMIDVKVSPAFAFEYSPYNGAPDFERKEMVDGLNHIVVHLNGVDAIEESMPYFSSARQVPYIKTFLLNNTARLEYVPSSARPGGVRIVIYPQFLNDVISSLNAANYPDKMVSDAESVVKNWKKAHPQASDREIVDATFLALRFVMFKNKQKCSARQFSKTFSKVLENMSTFYPGRVAVTSSRGNAPVDKLIHFDDAVFFTVVGDSCYFATNNLLAIPGSVPQGFDSEKAFKFDGAPYQSNLHSVVKYFSLPRSKAKENVSERILELSLDPDNEENMVVSESMKLKGNLKNMLGGIVPIDDVLDSWARYLGQKPLKRMSSSDKVEEDEERDEDVKELFQTMWNNDDITVEGYRFESIGCTPDSIETVFHVEGKSPGATSPAGKDLLVNIGKFTGKQSEVKGSARKRDISIVMPSTEQMRSTLRFRIPEGYNVIPESVSALNRNIVTKVGSFFVEAVVDGDFVVVNVAERYPVTLAPASSWPDMLKVLDASHEFSSATIALRPI